MASQLLPLELIDKCVECYDYMLRGAFQSDQPLIFASEFTGTLLGFDDYVNMVLENVTEFDYAGTQTTLPKILLNGNNICMVSTEEHPNDDKFHYADFTLIS
ncbi:DNA polymerase zeta [Ascosphaera pollenicola]|nr:DNA polymerase zeta [Ascosphaera pollenicola]